MQKSERPAALTLQGVFPPIPTPFEDGRFAPHRLTDNLNRLHDTGLAGYLLLGSNGEAPLLSHAEKLEVLRVARRAIPANKIMIAGTGQESTAATCLFTQQAADLGAAAALVLTPAYYRDRMSHEALRRHFETVAEASPIPVLIYNVPKFTSLNLAPGLVAQLAAHPNIIGMKDSAGNLGQLLELREKTPADFQILAGSDGVFFSALVHGFGGGILALSNIAPRACVTLVEWVQAQRWQEAAALAKKLAPVGRLIVSRLGVPGLKAALDELGYFGGAPRPPLLPLNAETRRDIREVLRQAELL
ncbi:MAG: dihydrodipicolinate synthase family protein [candidate division KSB1 bacterium]|nr:dihydrodipicolinate synthase family protein [candidate division KSB1 bacterium]MDZ7273109.1 dihydrodipicolinate synthase family protein [candidate division KSB1 bacterium]MDZ7285211.1 dihydrodipicolinate synthase family protein [candidate division KSB1 bacterium]MDZ7298243.1 dihydrodipicolinate synthase family protein [candidate division KSB1 bacterium]MDZ7309193.1 dihydrodipicolinate synthase family protein [candidate division KSB1 bacterium]